MTHTLSVKRGLTNEYYRVYLTRSLTRNMEWNVHNLPEHKNIIVPTGRWDDTTGLDDPQVLTRMCEAWQAMRSHTDYSLMWADIVRQYPQDLIQALDTNDLETVHRHFTHMYSSPLTVGMSQGSNEHYLLKNNNDIAQLRLLRNWDVLMGLCEFFGILNTQNHEQGSTYLNIEINKLVEAMDHLFPGDQSFHAPAWQGGAWGLDTSRGLFTDRDLMALYYAAKLIGYFPAYGINVSKAHMCEIGGGVGYTAYWLYKLGARNITQVDLPMSLL